MACYHPLQAYRTDSGEIVFSPGRGEHRELKLPCGRCIGCRLEHSRQWAVRCMHEAQMHEQNSYITLTYAPEHLPPNGSLHYPDFQAFMKRLRIHAQRKHGIKNVRFYMCGEYGENLSRPHYHAVVFGYDFADKTPFQKNKSGHTLCISAELTEIWGLGHCLVGDVTFQSAAYVARYIMKKQNGKSVNPDTGLPYEDHYYQGGGEYLTKEFNKMSLKPGIGANWWHKFKDDVKSQDQIIVNGKPCKPPKYYDKLHALEDPLDFEATQYQRYLNSLPFAENSTPERLEVREEVALAKISRLKRSMEQS